VPAPSHCPNPACSNHRAPSRHWRRPYGSYPTVAHGQVRRVRCRACGATASWQTESLHYFAKRRLPLYAVWRSLLGGASLREIADRYHTSPQAVQGAVLRLGRQAMAAELCLLAALHPRERVVFDGLRSFLVSKDYPCDITTVVEPAGETILTMEHTIFTRGGTTTAAQRRRLAQRRAHWRPEPGTMSGDISRVVGELWDYLRPGVSRPAVIDTDEHPVYRPAIRRSTPARHYRPAGLLWHLRTPGSAPRTAENRLFAVNYTDRLLRHRLREHTRGTIACGRHAVMQMHRAWIFAWDHNAHRPWRVKRPAAGVHAAQDAAPADAIRRLARRFFTRRIVPAAGGVPETIRRVWLCELPTPPVRWRTQQKGTTVRCPAYARRELEAAVQQAA